MAEEAEITSRCSTALSILIRPCQSKSILLRKLFQPSQWARSPNITRGHAWLLWAPCVGLCRLHRAVAQPTECT